MKALIVFLVFFISLPLFFINKYFVQSSDSHYVSIAIVNALFLLAAFIAIDVHRKPDNKLLWGSIMCFVLSLGSFILAINTLITGQFTPEKSVGRAAAGQALANFLYSNFGYHGVALLFFTCSILMFWAARRVYSNWQT